MRKSIIVAASQNGVIGANGKLPWHLPGDLKRFKELTMGHTLIMGRKTYESLPAKVRPLPGRTTIMLSRHPVLDLPSGAVPAVSLKGAISMALQSGEDEVFVCGGGEVYREALPLVDRVYRTVVERDFEGDTRFDFIPGMQCFLTGHRDAVDGSVWQLVGDAGQGGLGAARGEGDIPHRFEIWDRVR
jgi:dihydrofolate reductase